MKKTILILFFTIYFIRPTAFCQCELPSPLRAILTQSDSSTVLTSLFFSDYGKTLFNSDKYNQFVDESYNIKFNSKIEFENFVCEFSYDYQQLRSIQKKHLWLVVSNWVKNNDRLIKIANKYDVDELQLLYNVTETRKLFKPFFTNKYQDWGSLASGQTSRLFLNEMNYLSNLSDKENNVVFYKIKQSAIKLRHSINH